MAALPMKCRRYLTERGIAFEEVADGSQQAVILRGFALPPGRFNTSAADILVLLPAGVDGIWTMLKRIEAALEDAA